MIQGTNNQEHVEFCLEDKEGSKVRCALPSSIWLSVRPHPTFQQAKPPPASPLQSAQRPLPTRRFYVGLSPAWLVILLVLTSIRSPSLLGQCSFSSFKALIWPDFPPFWPHPPQSLPFCSLGLTDCHQRTPFILKLFFKSLVSKVWVWPSSVTSLKNLEEWKSPGSIPNLLNPNPRGGGLGVAVSAVTSLQVTQHLWRLLASTLLLDLGGKTRLTTLITAQTNLPSCILIQYLTLKQQWGHPFHLLFSPLTSNTTPPNTHTNSAPESPSLNFLELIPFSFTLKPWSPRFPFLFCTPSVFFNLRSDLPNVYIHIKYVHIWL